MNLYKNCIVTACSFLVIGSTLVSEYPLRFRKNLLEKI